MKITPEKLIEIVKSDSAVMGHAALCLLMDNKAANRTTSLGTSSNRLEDAIDMCKHLMMQDPERFAAFYEPRFTQIFPDYTKLLNDQKKSQEMREQIQRTYFKPNL